MLVTDIQQDQAGLFAILRFSVCVATSAVSCVRLSKRLICVPTVDSIEMKNGLLAQERCSGQGDEDKIDRYGGGENRENVVQEKRVLLLEKTQQYQEDSLCQVWQSKSILQQVAYKKDEG